MTRLSVNINKIATIRNARGGNVPDVTLAAQKCEEFGEIRPLIKTEFNIEGNPTVQSFVDLVMEVVPDQVTLVPDGHNAITSNAGWDTIANRELLTGLVKTFHSKGIRVSIFIDPVPEMAFGAAECGADRVELYTAAYAENYPKDPDKAIDPYLETAVAAALTPAMTFPWRTLPSSSAQFPGRTRSQ